MGAGTFSKTTFQLNMHKTLNKPASIHGRACGSINTDKTISYQKNLKLKVERLYCHINFVFFLAKLMRFLALLMKLRFSCQRVPTKIVHTFGHILLWNLIFARLWFHLSRSPEEQYVSPCHRHLCLWEIFAKKVNLWEQSSFALINWIYIISLIPWPT